MLNNASSVINFRWKYTTVEKSSYDPDYLGMKDALKPLHDRKQKEKKMDNSNIKKIQRRYIKLSI